ncbi:MAG: hypothetical protein ACYSR9_15750 [Planctomycetota bacterium]|jgi:hypothetical protein
MNLFRSEEHIKNWSGFKADSEEGIMQLSDMVSIFSGNLFTRRLDADYVSHMKEYSRELIGTLKDKGAFWQLPKK